MFFSGIFVLHMQEAWLIQLLQNSSDGKKTNIFSSRHAKSACYLNLPLLKQKMLRIMCEYLISWRCINLLENAKVANVCLNG